jgi:protein tyrosine phosphatase (PTP) superfamily phosphohydrolase (DUF442 family)
VIDTPVNFIEVDKGILWRSGQSTLPQFKVLKELGCKSIISLRRDKEFCDFINDTEIEGFTSLGFNYLNLPIPDENIPTDDKILDSFLEFVCNKDN